MLYLFDHIVHIFISFVQNFEIILQDTVTRLIFSALLYPIGSTKTILSEPIKIVRNSSKLSRHNFSASLFCLAVLLIQFSAVSLIYKSTRKPNMCFNQ